MAQGQAPDWEARRAAEKDVSPFVSRIIEYKPAPGQFINEEGLGTPKAAEAIVGGIDGLVSLGGFGGYIVLGFDHTIWNDPENPYGVDFTVVSNAAFNTSEPGIVQVMADSNGNGLPDDGQWYELKGSAHDAASTIRDYSITYTNPNDFLPVPWTDKQGASGEMAIRLEHQHPYYPLSSLFADYPQDEVSFSGTRIMPEVDESNPAFVTIQAQAWGYADNHPFNRAIRPYTPDDPSTTDVLEGSGGDAFDINWAIDDAGLPVYLEGIDFIRIYTGIHRQAGWLGELSTEISGVIDVSPDDISGTPDSRDVDLIMYPNPAVSDLTVEASDNIRLVEIWDMSGRPMHRTVVSAPLVHINVSGYPTGLYLVGIEISNRRVVRKLLVRR